MLRVLLNLVHLHAVASAALGHVQRTVSVAQQPIIVRMAGMHGEAGAGGNGDIRLAADIKRELAGSWLMLLRKRSRSAKASAAPVSTRTSRNSSPP